MHRDQASENKDRVLTDGELLTLLQDSGGEVLLAVTGSSMAPLLKNGKTTVVLSGSFTPSRGRILLYRRADGSLLLHRVRKVHRDGCLLMNGDAQSWCETIRPEQAVAAVVGIDFGKGRIKYNDPLLCAWDFLWYFTRPVRPQLFRFFGRIRKRSEGD